MILVSRPENGMNDYNFNDSSGNAGVSLDDAGDIMKKDYSIDDINENSHHNIFAIITNRYQRSALRRLFDDEGVSKADEANETEINNR